MSSPATATSRVQYLQATLASFEFYSSLFLLLPGVLLSTFTLVVFMRKRFWNGTTMGFYYATSTGIALYANILGLIAYFPASLNIDLQQQSDFACKIFWVLRPQGLFGSSYFQVFITLDRTLNSIYINRFLFLKKTRNLALITVIIQLAVAGGNAIEWWRFVSHTQLNSSSSNSSNSTSDLKTCTLPRTLLIIYDLEAILSRVVPSFVNFILNIIIIRALFKSKKTASRAISSKDVTFASSLIAQNFIFTVVTMPHAVMSGLQLTVLLNEPTSQYASEINILFNFGAFCSFAFEAMPFYMNIAFNKLFRSELRAMFCRSNQLGPGNSTMTTLTRRQTAN
jgi:hypothetical protein